ncbi:hypothetical protein GCM10009555_104380 [Acrocarpospora macrocephala]|uniref:Uncharacterized protein n=1 Tax=Acrocarpospora macrocephala TaxID=150177 RepID=A0A5M3WWT7_9ACTN|nr:hypothetical protein [Acrocarpospora macrocephala]GES12692.1 hypothetical protein Amac_062890 [Acrocarpospora macrocephala]
MSEQEENAPDAPRLGRRMLLIGVVAVGAVAVSLLAFPDRARVDSSAAAPATDLPPPLTDVWPEAVRELPLRLPNGKLYTPILFLDRDRMLIKSQSGVEKADLLSSYDLRTGEVKELARLVARPEMVRPASDFAVGSGTIVWRTVRRERGDHVTDIWTAPVTGGAATVRATTRPDRLRGDLLLHASSSATAYADPFHGLSVAGGNVYWSSATAGLWRLPLTGGAPPARVPGTAGYHLLAYPWMAWPDQFGRPLRISSPSPTPAVLPAYGELLNVETGQTRTAVIPPSWTCGLTRCLGPLPGSRDQDAATQSRDGSAQRRLPSLGTMGATIAQDRFSVLRVYGEPHKVVAVALVDLKTGEAGLVGMRGVENGLARQTFSHDSDLYHFKQNGKMIIVDLRAIY